MNLQELLRRLRAGETRAAISRDMKISVNTVKDHRQWAEAQGLLMGALPDLTTLEALRQRTYHPGRECHPNESGLESYRTEIAELVKQGYKSRAIWISLSRRYPGLAGSEAAVWRLVQSIRAGKVDPIVKTQNRGGLRYEKVSGDRFA